MENMLRKTMTIGFVFGIIVSIIAYVGRFQIDYALLWIIPFFAGILSGLGTIVSTFVSNQLIAKGFSKGGKTAVIGFIAAAIVNCLIALIILSFFGEIQLHRETTIVLTLGLGMGGVYGIYSYRISRLNEKMEFLEALADKNRQLQEASRKLTITEERNRMSRELHDSVSQGLHGLIFTLYSLRNEIKNPSKKVSDILAHMEATANSTLDELRTMIEELKPSLLAEEGLEEALKVTVNLFSQRCKIPVDIQIQVPEALGPEIEMTIYRITQEALYNIDKYAEAKNTTLKITSDNEDITLAIIDDGKGFDTSRPPTGNGINNMRQRTEDIGGSFKIVSKSGSGTSIIAKFPQKG